jgi:hypothetical protein
MAARKYRTTIGKGIHPAGDKAWCVHCDEWAYDDDGKATGPAPCNPSGCDCKCHTKLRKPKCLCAVVELDGPWDSPVGCCMDCDCFCHIVEQKEADRTEKARKALWKAELERREQERFKKEGVHDWEKEVLQYLMCDPSNLNYKYRTFVEVLCFSSDKKKAIGGRASETGAQFMERMLLAPWGYAYIQTKQTPAQK